MLANLAWALARKGLRKYEVARAVGMSESAFSRSLHERREFSPIEKQRIAELLGFEAGWLFQKFSRPPVSASSYAEPVPAPMLAAAPEVGR